MLLVKTQFAFDKPVANQIAIPCGQNFLLAIQMLNKNIPVSCTIEVEDSSSCLVESDYELEGYKVFVCNCSIPKVWTVTALGQKFSLTTRCADGAYVMTEYELPKPEVKKNKIVFSHKWTPAYMKTDISGDYIWTEPGCQVDDANYIEGVGYYSIMPLEGGQTSAILVGTEVHQSILALETIPTYTATVSGMTWNYSNLVYVNGSRQGKRLKVGDKLRNTFSLMFDKDCYYNYGSGNVVLSAGITLTLSADVTLMSK